MEIEWTGYPLNSHRLAAATMPRQQVMLQHFVTGKRPMRPDLASCTMATLATDEPLRALNAV
jgi:hypothetical protein